MSQQELVSRVVRALEDARIPYMVTGALASSLWGEPRTTHDIDLVIEIDHSGLAKLLEAFPAPDFYLDEAASSEAVLHRGTFNLIEVNTGEKVDFWLITDSPFDRSRFARRRAERIGGTRSFVSTPEDTVLVKLWWAQLAGGSEKQFTDALRVYEVQYSALDLDYLHSWAEKLGVTDLLRRLESEAETL